jgi:hypothetical protein
VRNFTGYESHPFERADPRLLQEIEELKSTLKAFSRIHEPQM